MITTRKDKNGVPTRVYAVDQSGHLVEVLLERNGDCKLPEGFRFATTTDVSIATEAADAQVVDSPASDGGPLR